MRKRELHRRAFLTGIGATACGASLKNFPFDLPDAGSGGIEVTYYSVGCFLIRFQETEILTDPFFSHLSFPRVAFGTTVTDPEQFDPYIPALANVGTVLVGHGHYDHILDLEAAAPHLAAGAKIFGGRTLQHIYAATDLPREIVAVNDSMATPEETGDWIHTNDNRLRILPIRSDHPNQYLFFHLFRKKLQKDATRPPTRVWDYQEGVTIAYLVDFLDPSNNGILARIYIQTSSTGYPAGYFPRKILDEKRIDVALLAMDCANIEARGENSIINFLDPPAVVFCHWEDFFRPKRLPPREIVKVDLPWLRERLPSTPGRRYVFPYWDSSYRFPLIAG